MSPDDDSFERDLQSSRRAERLVVWKTLGALAFVGLVVVVRQLWLS